MKLIKAYISFIIVIILFTSVGSTYAMEFNAETAYQSVFVIHSGSSLGSGFAVGKNCIVTNAHVLSSTHNIYVRSYSGEEYQATILGIDESNDIAVLGIVDANFSYLPIADISTMNIGDTIYAIGAPKNMAYTLTKGIISTKDRTIGRNTYIQIDAAINEGNSGGPLLNDNGQVLGMNTLKISDSEGIGLAIPSAVICNYLKELGIELDSSGNVKDSVIISMDNIPNSEQKNKEDELKKEETLSENKSISITTYIAFALAGVSLIGNIILFILLIHQRKKNLTSQYNSQHNVKDETDFDIDVWE